MFTTVSSLVTLLVGVISTWIVHKLWPAKSTTPSPVPPSGLLPGLNIAAKAESAGLSWLVPLLKALETANGPLIQIEAKFLHRLVEQQGGFAKLLDDAANQVLEARLAAGRAKYLVRAAADAGITPRELLDELEGKPAASAPSSPVIPVAAPLIVLALMLFGASSASAAYPLGPSFGLGPTHWNAEVHAPQRFYPTELNLIAEAADCNLPDPGPYVSINYFYANWCGDCAASTKVANDLDRKGHNIIIRDAGGRDGASYARACQVATVPFWIVRIDGRESLRTNDAQKVIELLSNNRQSARNVSVGAGAVYAPDGTAYGPNGYYQPAYYGNEPLGFWHRGPARRVASAPVRWFRNRHFRPLARLFGRGRC